jgi:tRNA-dihydrouridine synthase
MIGRGLLADPALARRLRGGPPAGSGELTEWYTRLYREWEGRYLPVQALGRIKKLMEWPAGGDIRKKRMLRKAQGIEECIRAVLQDAE